MSATNTTFTSQFKQALQHTIAIDADEGGDVVLILQDGRVLHLVEDDEGFYLERVKFHEC